jgi:hypothetical protein
MSSGDIAGIVAALGDLVREVQDADTADKAEIYAQPGLTLTYQPGRWLVESHHSTERHIPKGFVSEGDLNAKTGEISLIAGLNSKAGEESPDRGSHALMVASAPRLASSRFRRLPAETRGF